MILKFGPIYCFSSNNTRIIAMIGKTVLPAFKESDMRYLTEKSMQAIPAAVSASRSG